ncbi:MAG TPA: thiol:disulfide interchange protein DsbA/DsbL, partial [Steroidobacteraceae bacterium]|nr:thiol:disulfide interchange protein DsbA/DsbL [Steroidobacteraceae bacterium]
ARVQAATNWTEGQHYFAVRPAQRTNVAAGKIEVLEIFSYGCPYCYQLNPTIAKLKASLPKQAEMCYLPASFIPSEDWPMFQQAFYAADALGIMDKTHDAMFDAIWKTGKLAIVDFKTNRLVRPAPTIEDAASFYSRTTKIDKGKFIATAKSFSVAAKMTRADQLIKVYGVHETPTLIVNGKYRLTPASAGGTEQLIELVQWLIAKEIK